MTDVHTPVCTWYRLLGLKSRMCTYCSNMRAPRCQWRLTEVNGPHLFSGTNRSTRDTIVPTCTQTSQGVGNIIRTKTGGLPAL